MKFEVICPVEYCKWSCICDEEKDVTVVMAWNDFEVHLRIEHDWRRSEVMDLIKDFKRLDKCVRLLKL